MKNPIRNNLNLVILYSDANVVLLDKPSGLTVNRSETTRYQETLQDRLEEMSNVKCQMSNADKESDFVKRSGIVHRLDKDTSGLIIIAKNPQAFANLQKQFKDRQVAKTYLALVWGKLITDGEVNAPITRSPFNRKRFGIFVGGKEAHTRYKVIKNKKIQDQEVTLLEVTPITGRTHQIRVHLNYAGHPVVGDSLYSGQKLTKLGLTIFGRLMLHAYKISFIDPKSGKRVEFKSEIPVEFRKVM